MTINKDSIYDELKEYEEIWKYDDDNNVMYYELIGGDRVCWRYNMNGTIIYHKRIDGGERWYNDKGLLIHYRKDMFEQWWEYDDKGNKIRYKDSYGYEEYIEYNVNGNVKRVTDNEGFEKIFEYNETNNLISVKYGKIS